MEKQTCSFDEEKLIGYAYGDSTITDKLSAYFHIRKCTLCASVYQEYRQTSKLFDTVQRERCPTSVTDRVEKQIGLRKPTGKNIFDTITDFVFYRPSYVLSGSAVVILLAIVLTLQLTEIQSPVTQHYYSEAEIRQAEEDIGKTFAMIIPVVQDAEVNIREKIIKSQIVPPVQHSVERSNQLFRLVQ